MISPIQLTEELQAYGPADILFGNPLVAGGLAGLGWTEGEIKPNIPYELNEMTTELTGGAPHSATVTIGKPTVTFTIVAGSEALFPLLSPIGSASGGFSGPQLVTYGTLLVIPHAELAGGLAYDGTTWTRTAGRNYLGATGAEAIPKRALWFWKACLVGEEAAFRVPEGGKGVGSVTAHVYMDFTKPEGHKLFTRGNPIAAGVAGVRL